MQPFAISPAQPGGLEALLVLVREYDQRRLLPVMLSEGAREARRRCHRLW